MKQLLRITAFTLMTLLVFSLPATALAEKTEEYEYAEAVGSLISILFTPEQTEVTVQGKSAWIKATGAKLDNIRAEKIIFRANFKEDVKKTVKNRKPEEILKNIDFAEGELVIFEKDINSFFAGEEIKGFTNLSFDFTPSGYRAKGDYKSDFTFGRSLHLEVTGNLAPMSDGIYFAGTDIYINGSKQPGKLSEIIISTINPLLSYKDIPFKIEFKEIKMDDNSITATSDPKMIDGGSTWKSK